MPYWNGLLALLVCLSGIAVPLQLAFEELFTAAGAAWEVPLYVACLSCYSADSADSTDSTYSSFPAYDTNSANDADYPHGVGGALIRHGRVLHRRHLRPVPHRLHAGAC